MSDRIFHTEAPLTDAERAQRLDPATRIRVDHTYARPVVGRDWVRDTAGDEARYGYAEKRTTERVETAALDLKVEGLLDPVGLTRAILDEVNRQRGLTK